MKRYRALLPLLLCACAFAQAPSLPSNSTPPSLTPAEQRTLLRMEKNIIGAQQKQAIATLEQSLKQQQMQQQMQAVQRQFMDELAVIGREHPGWNFNPNNASFSPQVQAAPQPSQAPQPPPAPPAVKPAPAKPE